MIHILTIDDPYLRAVQIAWPWPWNSQVRRDAERIGRLVRPPSRVSRIGIALWAQREPIYEDPSKSLEIHSSYIIQSNSSRGWIGSFFPINCWWSMKIPSCFIWQPRSPTLCPKAESVAIWGALGAGRWSSDDWSTMWNKCEQMIKMIKQII